MMYIDVTEVDKVNKRVKIRFVGCSTQFDEWTYLGGTRDPSTFHFFVEKGYLH